MQDTNLLRKLIEKEINEEKGKHLTYFKKNVSKFGNEI